VPPLRGLKRLGFGLALVIAASVCALVALPFFISADAVRSAVQAEIRSVTGLDPVLGDVSISLFPSGSASFSGVTLRGDAGTHPALSAERLTAQLRFLPLLLGRIEVAEVKLEQPHILIDIDRSGSSNWAPLVAGLGKAIKPEASSPSHIPFSEIRLMDGTVAIHDQARKTTETLSGVDMSLAWPSIAKSFGATGHFTWHGDQVDASVTLNDFLAALKGGRSGLKLRLAGAPLKVVFDGQFAHKPTLRLDGTLSADSASLRNAMRWIGREPLPGGGFGRFALKAQTNVVGNTVALSNVNVELDGNSAEGVLTFSAESPLQLHGTLAADGLDVTPYLSTIRLLGANDRDWSRVPIRLDGLDSMEFDVRLSAAHVLLAGTKIGRTALAATLRGGQLSLTIGESQAFDGTLKGAVTLAKAEPGADLDAHLQFNDVNLENCVTTLFGIHRLEGRGDMTINLKASGNDILSLARSAQGSGTLTAANGAVTGVNVEQLLRRLERRPLSGPGDFRTGRTPFDKLTIALKIADGTASVETVKLDGAAVQLGVTGFASIPARDLNLRGVASLAAGGSDATKTAFELPFVVRGRWDDPVMQLDAQSLIRRSGAAAPLLEAVRNGKAHDAVRAAIEKLTHGLVRTGPTAAASTTPAAAEQQ
jgi:AsmA protein